MAKVITCGLYLISRNNNVLICHPTGSGDEWSIPKGKQEEGEKSFDTAVRETKEETGIKVSVLSNFGMPMKLPDRMYKSGRKILKSFALFEQEYRVLPDEKIEDFKCYCDSTIRDDGRPEMDDYKWVSLKKAKKMLHESQVENLDIIKKMLED
jgi:8-oxo-dGTP pyrophosphatase MutT (NUDIX family)